MQRKLKYPLLIKNSLQKTGERNWSTRKWEDEPRYETKRQTPNPSQNENTELSSEM